MLYTTSKHAVMGMVKRAAGGTSLPRSASTASPRAGSITDLRGVPSLGMADMKIGDVMNPEMAKVFMPFGFMR